MASRDGGPRLQAQSEARRQLELAGISREAEDAFFERNRRRLRELPDGVAPNDLSQAGWGVIFAPEEIERGIEQKLQRFLGVRKREAGELFKRWIYRGEGPRDFLYKTLETSPGTINPRKTPYYLLIVGSPEQIPFEIQQALSVNFAVGRIYFPNAEDYYSYASSVLDAEDQGAALPRQVDLFVADRPDDKAIEHLKEYFVEPLLTHLSERVPEWQTIASQGLDGSKEHLLEHLGGPRTPGLLVAATHGIRLEYPHPEQEARQGALSCTDGGLVAQDLEQIDHSRLKPKPLHGLIAWLTACYGAGTPMIDGFPTERLADEPASEKARVVAEREFVASLPQAMLARGALAVVGHVDRGWTLSYRWLHRDLVLEAARSVEDSIVQLLKGQRLGHAMRPVFRRASALTAQLVPMLEAQAFGLEVREEEIRVNKVAAVDARGHIILGDPAVYALGRPRGPAMIDREQMAGSEAARPIYLDPAVVLKARGLAEREGKSLHDWINDAVERHSRPENARTEGPSYRDGRSL